MMLPLLDDPAEVEYVWYVGDPVPTTGLYKRTGRYETPIYQNTRGQGVFVGASVEDGSIESSEPTPGFWKAINQIVEDDWPVDASECQWYEREFISAVIGVAAESDAEDIPTEVGQLFDHAKNGHHTQTTISDHDDAEDTDAP